MMQLLVLLQLQILMQLQLSMLLELVIHVAAVAVIYAAAVADIIVIAVALMTERLSTSVDFMKENQKIYLNFVLKFTFSPTQWHGPFGQMS